MIIAVYKDPIMKIYYRLFKKFDFNGKTYSNFYHYYNTTWRNERTVEVPITKRIVDENKGKKIFEFGDVLKNYYPSNHDVLDKYEAKIGIINEDIVGYKTRKKYDLIFSISTVEHVGWDERPKDPKRVLVAIETMKNMLKPNGTMFITFPFGYNLFLDELISKAKFPFNELKFLKRTDKNNRWVETDYNDARLCSYGKPYQNGNGMIFAYYKKGNKSYYNPKKIDR